MYRMITLSVFIFTACILNAQVSVKESPIQLIPDLSKTIDVDFRLAGGLILMNAENDGEKGEYILDTGAPCLILNEVVEKGELNIIAVGVGGQMKVSESNIKKFRLGKYIKEQIKCLSIDISHIERLKKRKIDGLIGYEMFKDKELLFDYNNLLVSFLDGKRYNEYKGQKRLKTLPFKMHGHMPIIKVSIGNKNFRFGIDTGAEVNVINTEDAKKIKDEFYVKKATSNIQSIDEKKTGVNTIELDRIAVSKKEVYKNLSFIITDLSNFNQAYGVELDGLLGYSFLKERLHSIDFRNKELVIWEEKIELKN